MASHWAMTNTSHTCASTRWCSLNLIRWTFNFIQQSRTCWYFSFLANMTILCHYQKMKISWRWGIFVGGIEEPSWKFLFSWRCIKTRHENIFPWRCSIHRHENVLISWRCAIYRNESVLFSWCYRVDSHENKLSPSRKKLTDWDEEHINGWSFSF